MTSDPPNWPPPQYPPPGPPAPGPSYPAPQVPASQHPPGAPALHHPTSGPPYPAPRHPAPGQVPPLGKAVERPHPLTGLAKSWIALFGLVFVVGREVAENGVESVTQFGPFVWFFGSLALIGVVLSGAWGVIEWRTTTFVADDDEFRIERNFLSRESSRISYAKIQSVDIERSLVARLLGLASVQIDVGGAGGKKLEYLGRERAEALRDQLLARMRSLAQTTGVAIPAVAAEAPASHAAPPPPGAAPVGTDGNLTGPDFRFPDVPATAQPAVGTPPTPVEQVVTMLPTTLLLGVLVSSFLPWLLGGVAFLVVMLVVGQGFSIAAVGGVIFGVGGYLWSQLVNNWDFTLTRVPEGLHIRRGLFTKVSRSLKADRIQAVSIHQDYLQRLTGLYRVRVTVLGFGGMEEGGEKSDIVLPYGNWDDVRRVLGAFWPGINIDSIPLNGQPDRARWLTPLGFKRHQWGFDQHTLVSHHGWLDHTISLVPHRRMQSIGIRQGPLQRRLRLATVAIHTTDGPVGMQMYHLDPVDARELFDSQVERARLAREQPGEPDYLTALPAPDAATRAS